MSLSSGILLISGTITFLFDRNSVSTCVKITLLSVYLVVLMSHWVYSNTSLDGFNFGLFCNESFKDDSFHLLKSAIV